MTNHDIKIDFNFVIKGKTKPYDSWEISPRDLPFIELNNFVCLLSYVTLPKKHHYFHKGFYENTDAVKKLISNRIIYSYIFIPVNDLSSADQILNDIVISK